MMNNENGRSMVEMLGVLAIIGVLSVAGIAGYSIAMRKYRTNEILNAASQLVVLAQAKLASGQPGTASSSELGYADGKVVGYTMTATCDNQGNPDCVVTKAADDTTGQEWTDASNAAGTYYDIS